MGKENIIDIGKSTVIENRYVTALDIFEKRINNKNCSWLDIGVGDGMGTDKIASQDINLTAIDIEVENLTKINTEKRIQCDGCYISLKNSSYDVISNFEVLEHLEQDKQAQFISEISRVLKPGGILFISTPDKNAHGNTPMCPSHINELTSSNFQNLLTKQGFLIENTYGQLFFKKDKSFHKLFMSLRQNKIAKNIYFNIFSDKCRTTIKNEVIYPSFYEKELMQVRNIKDNETPRIIYAVCTKPNQ